MIFIWYDEYETLSPYEKGEFRRIANYLLSHSYIVHDQYNTEKMMNGFNNDYRLALRYFCIMKDYFEVIGWKMCKDESYGFISISSEYDNNRLNFDKFTTLFLYTLRLIYEEEREKISINKTIRVNTHAVVEKMIYLGLAQFGKVTIKERENAQRILFHHNIIQKLEKTWNSEGNELIINHSITAIISNESINSMYSEIEEFKVSDDLKIDNSCNEESEED